MRVVLGTSALLVVLIDSMEARAWATPIHLTLAFYSLYGLLLYHLSIRRKPLVAHKIIPWLDLLWYLPLVAFTRGTNSNFYYFFFFSIIVASFTWGLTDGLRLTLASAALYTIVAVLAPGNRPIVLNRLLLAPIGLLIFGYIIARWGGYHTELKNRLKLLKEVTIFSNPRFGIDRTIKAILESVRAFYDAEACLLVIPGKAGDAESYQLYRVARGIHPSRSAPPEIGSETAAQFLSPSLDYAVIYSKKSKSSQTRLFDIKTRVFSETNSQEGDKLAGMLEAQRYLSVPVYYRHQAVGRMFIIDGPNRVDGPDMDFVQQL